MKARGKITQVEVSAALQKFIKKGGMIKRLPDQEYKPATPIGEEKYQIYEPISDLSKIADNGDTLQ